MPVEMLSPPLRTDVRVDTNCTIIRVEGELDMATAPVLSERLAAAIDDGARRIDLDLSGVSFMDTSGLQAVFVSSIRAMCAGRALVLSGLSDPVRNVLRITGMLSRFDVRD